MRIAVVGAGISGAACTSVLRSAGFDVDLLDRGRAPGGRMSAPMVHGRRVDLGAAYFTARDDDFVAVVQGWRSRGLARPWTDTFDVFSADGRTSKGGSQRWAAQDGLRALVRDLLPPADVQQGRDVADLADLDHDAVVLAMPDPQAARLAPDIADWVDYEPVIAVAAGFADRTWDLDAAAFVNDDPDITLIADDGARRGDGAPVLVVHTGAEPAAAHLTDPNAVIAPTVAAARRLLGLRDEPEWTRAHRWTFAKPVDTHGDEPFALVEHGGRPLGVCGDSWCPQGPPRVESAWLSGTRLGRELVQRLG